MTANDLLKTAHPLHKAFKKWVFDRHPIDKIRTPGFVPSSLLTKRQARRFLQTTVGMAYHTAR